MLVHDLKKKLGPYYKKHMSNWPNLNELEPFKEAILHAERDVKLQSTSDSHQVNAVDAQDVQVAAFSGGFGRGRGYWNGYGRGNYGGENTFRGRGNGENGLVDLISLRG